MAKGRNDSVLIGGRGLRDPKTKVGLKTMIGKVGGVKLVGGRGCGLWVTCLKRLIS